MTCDINVTTSISGNVLTTIPSTPSFGAPIVLTGTLTISVSGAQLSNIPVSSGVRFSTPSDLAHLIIGGVSGNMASFVTQDDFRGIRIASHSMSEIIPVTNLNQLSVAGSIDGKKISYFAVSISG